MNVVNGLFPFSLNQMTFAADGPAYTLAGVQLNFRTNSTTDEPQIVFDSDSFDVLNPTIDLTNNLTITGTGTGTLAFNSTLSGPGSLTYSGAGTMQLGAAVQSYTGGTFVTSGRLLLGNGTAIPTNSDVTVSGRQFDIGSFRNLAATAIGTLSVSDAGVFRVPSGGSNYYLNQLTMNGGTVDFTGTSNFWLRFVNSGAAINVNANSNTATWIGDSTSRIQNDTGDTLIVTVNQGTTPSGIDLDAGISLSSGGSNPNFRIAGNGTTRLSSLNNTANITIFSPAKLRVDDLSTNGVGVLGTGTIDLRGALQYGGPTATSTKAMSLSHAVDPPPTVQVLNADTTLTLNGAISDGPFWTGSLTVNGPGTLALGNGSNTYSGGTLVDGGTLLLANGAAIPTGGNVTVSGGEFNTNGLGNGDFSSSSNAIGTVAVSGTGTFRIPSGAANYHLNKLEMTGGTVDMTGAGAAYLHFRNAGAGITTNASSTTAVMTGGPLTRLQNDTGSAASRRCGSGDDSVRHRP